jgi:8-oxo-dGTP pyrophosphatase MutT (NUDIX family)
VSAWKTLSTEDIYSTPWITVRRDEVQNHNGKHLTYSVVDLKNPSVYIVATDSDGRIYLHKNYRYTIDKEIWSIPAGHSESTDYLADAKRELQEEANLASDDWIYLGEWFQATGTANMPIRVFLARNAYTVDGKLDEIEDISAHRYASIKEIETMANGRELCEISTLGAIYLAKLHGL